MNPNKIPAPGPYEVVVIIDEEGKARGAKGEKWVLIRNGDGAIASVYPALNAEATANLLAGAFAMSEALKGLNLYCLCDVLNPCWDNRPNDVRGLHWGSDADRSVSACVNCNARAALFIASGVMVCGTPPGRAQGPAAKPEDPTEANA